MHARMWERVGTAIVLITTLNLHGTRAVAQGGAQEYRQLHMGMEVRLVLHGDPRLTDPAARAAFARIAALEDVLSDWRPTSELRRLTSREGAVPVSRTLFTVTQRALEIARASHGAFDPTIAPLVSLWREARRTRHLPSDSAVAEARERVGWEQVQLDATDQTIRFDRPRMQLDLGAIAKGWILGEARVTLREHGVRSFLIEAGGDLLLGDAPPESSGWRIAIATAAGDSVVILRNIAVATSGPSAQFVEIDGVHYSHVIDPRSGRPLTTAFAVTVLHEDPATADALATTITVLGASDGRALAARFGARVITRTP